MTSFRMQHLSFFCLLILTAIGLSFALAYSKPIIMPFIFALFYYLSSMPIVEFLEKHLKTPRVLAFLITFLLIGGASSIIFIQIGLSMKDFIHSTDLYHRSFLDVTKQINEYIHFLGVQIDTESLISLFKNIPLATYAKQFIGSTLGFLGNSFMAMIIYFFLMMNRSESPKTGFYKQIEKKISRYIINKLLLSAFTGFLVSVILLGFKIELAISIGILTALLNFIPSIGSIIATMLPVPLIILKYGFGGKLVIIFSLCAILQMLIGNFLDPKIIGKELDLNPIVIILSLVFWGLLWGIGGMFLAVPLTAIIKIIIEHLQVPDLIKKTFNF